MAHNDHILSEPESLSENLPHNSPVHHTPSAPRWTMVMGAGLVMLAALLCAFYFLYHGQ